MTPRLPRTLTVEARAKVNLFLRVLGPRPDGYHELETLVTPVDFADHLEIHAASGPEFRTLALALDITGDVDIMLQVPADESNLVLRAARALANTVEVRGFAEMTLEKRVPAAAGLGGGSADAAATLRVLNELWECGLEESALSEVASSVGSDVPALLVGGPVLARGRGDRVEPLPVPSLKLALVTFPFGVTTADAFRWWDEEGGTSGADPGPIFSAARGGSGEALGGLLYNDLEDVVLRRHPAVGEAKERLLHAGALGAVMSGSGPTLVALLPADGSFEPPVGLETRSVRTAATSGGS